VSDRLFDLYQDYSEHNAMTYHFPDAFYGQNTKIRETLNNLILKSPQDWQTGVALPFVRITGTVRQSALCPVTCQQQLCTHT
jgi:hypothetical protein